MMADFHDLPPSPTSQIGAEVGNASEETCFTRLAGVAHEEFAEIIVAQHYDDAVTGRILGLQCRGTDHLG